MPVRSLFLKVFLSFWATLVIMVAALSIAFTLLQPDETVSRWQSVTGDAMALYANSAVQIAESQGPAAAAAFLERAQLTSHIRASLLGPDLQPIVGNVTADQQRLAAEAQRSGRSSLVVRSGAATGAQSVIGASGRKYVLVVELPRNRPGPLRGGWREQAIRWSVALLVSGLICWALTRYLTAPIFRLRMAARQIAGGDLSARASPALASRRDEFGELVQDFNHMSERIESLVRSQQQLIRDISHELRSPLARLNVALGLARQRAGVEAAAHLDRIERESERLNEMIGRLLTLARVQASERPPDPEPVALLPLIQQIADDARFECSRSGCNVTVRAAGDCVVKGSPDLLRSAIENVVRNAIRYTASGTSVEISLECGQQRSQSSATAGAARGAASDGTHALITIRDHGPGVPNAELENVFRPFYRVEGARERDRGGTGIGLAITDAVARLHGGSARARNADDGGLIVEVEFPQASRTV
jgi:two-component system, OmpR family, sensor histidine kinase CpxA